MNRRKIADSVGLGDLTLGHRELADEPLTVEDWAEIHRVYLAFQHHVRLVVLKAREFAPVDRIRPVAEGK